MTAAADELPEDAVDTRWTRVTVATVVAALTLVVVLTATLLLRADDTGTSTVPGPQDGSTPTPAAAPTGDAGGGDVAAGSGDATSGGTSAPPEPTGDGPEQDAAALAAATTFLGDVAGMSPVPGPVSRHGDHAEVTVYGRGEDGRVARAVTTVVDLRRSAGGWSPTGASTPTIVVDTPASGATVTSPLTVSGRARADEGTVAVTVVEDRPGSHTIVGEGFVTGAGDRLGPFSGEIEVVEHNSERGWVVFTESSAADGSTMRATIVRVEFADELRPGGAAPRASGRASRP